MCASRPHILWAQATQIPLWFRHHRRAAPRRSLLTLWWRNPPPPPPPPSRSLPPFSPPSCACPPLRTRPCPSDRPLPVCRERSVNQRTLHLPQLRCLHSTGKRERGREISRIPMLVPVPRVNLHSILGRIKRGQMCTLKFCHFKSCLIWTCQRFDLSYRSHFVRIIIRTLRPVTDGVLASSW